MEDYPPYLYQAYLRVWEGIHRLHMSQWPETDLTMPQVKVLFAVKQGVDTVGGLAARLGVSPPVITGIIDRLEARGLVTRARDPNDRRMVKVRLTEKGLERVRGFQNLSESIMNLLFSRLSDEEYRALLHGFTAVERELNALLVEKGLQKEGEE